MNELTRIFWPRLALGLAMALVLPGAAAASNGLLADHPEEETDELRVSPTASYYEEVTEGRPWRATAESGLPERLHVVEGGAFLRYRPVREGLRGSEWEVRVEGFARHHEPVDAVYDMVLVLPLPEDAAGRDGFRALEKGITLSEGDDDPRPLLYGGQPIVLHRNPALERALLPGWTDAEGVGKLPSLAGTGYRYTVWDAVVAHDPDHGHVVQGSASLRYQVPGRIAAPDADDDRLAAYWVTWIPALSAEVAPYTLRLDVRD